MPIYDCERCDLIIKNPHFAPESKCENCKFNFNGGEDGNKRVCAGGQNSFYGYGNEITDDTKFCSLWMESLEYFIDRNERARKEHFPTKEENLIAVCPKCGKKVSELFRPTDLAEYFGASIRKVNPALLRLGLIQQIQNGWAITELGESLGGKQIGWQGAGQSTSLVCWRENIFTYEPLVKLMEEIKAKKR